ncbi:pseudaminic acid synthase [Candidatus Omnitrophota bacterium]
MKLLNKNRCLIVAEVSANHAKDLNTAFQLIKKAKESGADAVKFQTYTPDSLTIDVTNKYFRIKHPEWGGQTLYQLYKKAYTPWDWFKKLKKKTDNLGILFFSTAFDKKAVDLLEELDVPVHKISSFELVDLSLVEYAAKTKKPLILSTGMASISDIKNAVNIAKRAGAKEIVLLACISSYPAKAEDMRLKKIEDMKKRFKLHVGISDHTLDARVSILAASLGASLIEKHFTLSRKMKTPDSFFSIEPEELKSLVEKVKVTKKGLGPKELKSLVKDLGLPKKVLGKASYSMTKDEKKSLVFRRSLFVVKDIKKGESFTEENVRSIRPSYGIKPKHIDKIIGKVSRKDIKLGTPLSWDFID